MARRLSASLFLRTNGHGQELRRLELNIERVVPSAFLSPSSILRIFLYRSYLFQLRHDLLVLTRHDMLVFARHNKLVLERHNMLAFAQHNKLVLAQG